jgi:hypothetical protein
VLTFEGGHDEGSVQTITLTLDTGEDVELEPWYCGGYGMKEDGKGGYDWVPLSEPENEDDELADLLEGPINQEFGSWGDVPTTEGTLTWDVFTEKAVLNFRQERYQEFNERVSF